MTQWNKEAFKLKSHEKHGYIVSKHESSLMQNIYTLTTYIMKYDRLAYRIFMSGVTWLSVDPTVSVQWQSV
jgi:hypothetical protein